MTVLELAVCAFLAAGGVLMVWHAVIGLRAWRRAHRRPHLRLVARSTPAPRRFRGGVGAPRAGTPLPRSRTQRRRRVEVAYLRCISGGAHAASAEHAAAFDIATGRHESRRR